MSVVLLTVALMVSPATSDQWTRGDRWPTCSVTYSTGVNTKAFKRAVKDVERASGINLVRVKTGGQVVITQSREVRGDRLAEALPLPDDRGRYVSAHIVGWGDMFAYSSWARRAVWRHEWSHVLGLGHVDDPTETMAVGLVIEMTDGWRSSLQTLYPEC